MARTVLYTGVTNSISRRLSEHIANQGNPSTFAGRCNCQYLLYYEEHQWVQEAIRREKVIKKWPRAKKIQLILSFNPEVRFLDPPD